ncbi:MAG: 50S ribosomal protein L18 [Patescibacteria group bacterium]
MNPRKTLNKIRQRRKKRARAKIFGTSDMPRLSIFRSNRYDYVQLIDDEKGKTMVSATTKELENSKLKTQNSKLILAGQLGELIGKKAVEKGIKRAVFDRGKYKYHGRVKAIAEGARKSGLQL